MGSGAACVFVGLVGVAFVALYLWYASGLRPADEVGASEDAGGAQIFDRNGQLLYQYVDPNSGLRSPVKLEDISPYMIAATISTEDASFWTNPGINAKGVARAGLEYLHLKSADASQTTGGSSITQQLARNVYISPNQRYNRTVMRKFKETAYAVALTDKYSKNQILEWYLNQISYGGLYNGVEAAAEGYFGKHAKDLNLAESAMLAGIPASPSDYDPLAHPDAAVNRRNQVLQLLNGRREPAAPGENGSDDTAVKIRVNEDGTDVTLTNADLYTATLTPLALNPQPHFPVQAPHFVFDVIAPELIERFGADALARGGLRVTTSLDLDLENKGQAALDHWIGEFEDSAQGHNGAMVSIDPKTSEVLVYIGSRDYFNTDIQGNVDNAAPAKGRSPGSTLKPFTYTAAFEDLGWGANTEILDTPITYDDNGKPFTPANPAHDFHGPTPVHIALGNSLNVPAFKTALYVGVPQVVSEYKKFGITGLNDGNTYGPSVTIGGVDVKLSDVTYAYSVLAANGVMRGVPSTGDSPAGDRTLNPVTILKVERADGKVIYPATSDHQVHVQEQRVVDPQYAYMINSILSDGNNFCLTYGCNALSIGRQWAVKTGTSEPFENSTAIGDTWTYAYTPDLVTGAWFGNADNSPMHNITSTSVSYRSVHDFMEQALADTAPSDFARPDGLAQADVCEPSGLKATPACGRVVKNELPADKAPTRADDWWRSVKIDKRNGLLATDRTPAEFVEERHTFVIPDGVQGFARQQAEEWARILGIAPAPTQQSPEGAPTVATEAAPTAATTGTPFPERTPPSAATAARASPTRPSGAPTEPPVPTLAADTPTPVVLATPTP